MASPAPQDKAKQKAKEKVVEDKTFGLKNKGKSAKVQKYVQQLQKSAQPQRNPRLEEPSRKVGAGGGAASGAARAPAPAVAGTGWAPRGAGGQAAGGCYSRELHCRNFHGAPLCLRPCFTSPGHPRPLQDKKKAEEERAKELASLFATAIKQPKVPAGENQAGAALPLCCPGGGLCRRVPGPNRPARLHPRSAGLSLSLRGTPTPSHPPGVDPKSIVCEFFRHGQCTKGFKCKFSHDLAVERKTMKADIFTDRRASARPAPAQRPPAAACLPSGEALAAASLPNVAALAPAAGGCCWGPREQREPAHRPYTALLPACSPAEWPGVEALRALLGSWHALPPGRPLPGLPNRPRLNPAGPAPWRRRDKEEEEGGMEDWDQETLEKAIARERGHPGGGAGQVALRGHGCPALRALRCGRAAPSARSPLTPRCAAAAPGGLQDPCCFAQRHGVRHAGALLQGDARPRPTLPRRPLPAHPPALAEKHGNENKNRPTAIICKFFLEAVEKVSRVPLLEPAAEPCPSVGGIAGCSHPGTQKTSCFCSAMLKQSVLC